MIERVVENWLINANERSMEIPFCQLLTSEGYQVIHLSRHGPFEQGKDILAIDPAGVPCAFQLKSILKGQPITQTAWAREYLDQINRLVELPIKHPSIDQAAPRRVFFVINGTLDEEVRLEIIDRNLDWERRGYPKLETLMRGQLLQKFIALNTELWPNELDFERELLELFLADGRDVLPKERLANLLERLMLAHAEQRRNPIIRICTSAALITAYALTSYEEANNHVAVFEGWVVYIAYLAALVEKLNLEEESYSQTLSIAAYAIEQALEDLANELKERQHLVEGDPLVDQPFYRGRATWLIGLMANLSLSHLFRQQVLAEDTKLWMRGFISSYKKYLLLWGEGAVIDFLLLFWHMQKTEGYSHPEILLFELMDSLIVANSQNINGQQTIGIADPYLSLVDVIKRKLGLESPTSASVTFSGRSYTLESLVYLLVRNLWRQQLNERWVKISRLTFMEFKPDSTYEFCRWRNDNGNLSQRFPKTPQSWRELQIESKNIELQAIPRLFREHPELLLSFTMVFRHRVTPNIVKFLDTTIMQKKRV